MASTGITAFNLGGVVGALAGGVCIARWGSRVSMLLMTALAVVSAGSMSLMDLSPGAAVLPIITMLAITGGLINGVQTTMYALARTCTRRRFARPAWGRRCRSAESALS